MKILFVCHSTGDTNVLFSTARKLIKKNNEVEIHFLMIGEAAERAQDNLKETDLLSTSDYVRFTRLSDLPNIEIASLSNLTALDEAQRGCVNDFLSENNFTSALIGTPSCNVEVPFQIASMLAAKDEFSGGFHYNDYLLDEEHIYWQAIANNEEWQQHFTWLLPLPKAQKKFASINDTLTSAVVGHPSIDAAIENSIPNPEQVRKIRGALKIEETDTFIFMSGSKNLEDDKSCLNTLLNNFPDNTAIRIGLHPGANNLTSHIEALAEIASMHSEHVKFIITPRIRERIEAEKQEQDSSQAVEISICEAEIDGDTAARTADAVASARPATLATQAATTKPAYINNTEIPSFLPEEGKLFIGENQVSFFYDAARQRKARQKPLSEAEIGALKAEAKSALGLPEKRSTDIMANYLLSRLSP